MTRSDLLIQSLEKGLAVLECFRDVDSLGLQEIASKADITMGSAQRVAYTLEQTGYLHKDARTKRYRVTVKALGLGYSYLRSVPLFQQAHAVMHQLNQTCGEIVNLSVPDEHDHMVFVMRVAPSKHIPIYMPIGTRIPWFATASGRALFACLPQTKLNEKLALIDVAALTRHTQLDVRVLQTQVEQARTDLFAYADEAYYAGDINVASAIRDEHGQAVSAINISVPKTRWTLAQAIAELGPLVVQAARAISRTPLDR